MGGFDVSSPEVQAAAAQLQDVAQEVRTATASLHAEVESMLDGGWRGRAATGFAQGWQQWRTGAEDVLSALAAMSELLGATGQDYDGSEQANTSVINESGPMS